MIRVLALIACLAPTTSQAEEICPASPDREAEKSKLYDALLLTKSEADARLVAGALWEEWLKAPDARAQDLLDRAMARREAYDFADAEAILDKLVAYCPDYAEGYNQRAFARFLRENYEGALVDLEVVLSKEPRHFGALSGKALSLMRMGRMGLGQKALREAVAVHPWLSERAMLVDDQDI